MSHSEAIIGHEILWGKDLQSSTLKKKNKETNLCVLFKRKTISKLQMNLLSGKSQNPLNGLENSSAGGEGVINHLENEIQTPKSISSRLARAHTSISGCWEMLFFFFFFSTGNHYCMHFISPVSPVGSCKGREGAGGERKSCQHWAAAQPMLDCRYKHYTLHQQSCGEWAINLPGGALQGRLTMQVQSHCVIWRHPEQLKIHCSL